MDKTKKPNIIFILIDDMGWKDIACNGSAFYETPNIDALAKQGMRFTEAYASCPVCSPTRASILSGKYPATVGVTDWIDHGNTHPCSGKLLDAPYIKHLPLEEVNLAKALKNEGYQTWHVGKWHLGTANYYPDNQGFDINIGGCDWGSPSQGYFSPYGIETLEDKTEDEYLTDRITDEAIKLIEEKGNEPFFLNLWHYAVHTPIQAKEEDIEYFKAKAKTMGIDTVEPFEEGENFPCDHKKHMNVTRRTIQSDPAYAAMIYNLDKNIGRLMEAIKVKGVEEDTMIIFTSDNGGLATAEGSPTCNAPLAEGKGWMYEGGVREPLIIKWPATINAGSVCNYPCTSPDFYPTLLEAVGADLKQEQHVDGVSFYKALRGEAIEQRPPMFWHYPHYGNQGGTPGSSVREGDYKLIEFFEDKRLELYDLSADVGETTNLVEQEPEITKALHQKLVQWRESIEAKIPQNNPNYCG